MMTAMTEHRRRQVLAGLLALPLGSWAQPAR
jgi:hypothetical protein